MDQAKNMMAGGTIIRSRFVRMDSSDNNVVIASGANTKVVGISQESSRVAPIPEVTTDPPNAAIVGEVVKVYGLGQTCLLEIGSGGCLAGDWLKSGSGGVGIALTDDDNGRVGALALSAANSGELATVQVVLFTHLKNAS